MQNFNFRRKLKHLLKNAQRQKLNGERVSNQFRDIWVNDQLKIFGLCGSFASLSHALNGLGKAKSKHFRRLGRAAKKQNKLVNVCQIAFAVENGEDLRTIEFLN